MLNGDKVVGAVLYGVQFMLHHLLKFHVILLLSSYVFLWRQYAVLVVILHRLSDRVEFALAKRLQSLHHFGLLVDLSIRRNGSLEHLFVEQVVSLPFI